jgi:hypothetical protein
MRYQMAIADTRNSRVVVGCVQTRSKGELRHAALTLRKQRSPGSPPIRATCDKGSRSVPAVG